MQDFKLYNSFFWIYNFLCFAYLSYISVNRFPSSRLSLLHLSFPFIFLATSFQISISFQCSIINRQSPSRVALRRVSSSASVTSAQGCDSRSTHLFPILGSTQGRSRSPSPIKVGFSPRLFKKGRSNSAVSPKKIAKARSELFSPVYESECAVCKDTSHSKEKAHQSLHSSIPSQLKRFASFKSPHVNVSQLKRICSDPLYPRSPLLEEQIANTVPVPSSPTEKICHSPARGTISSAHRRSSDSDLSTTPKGMSRLYCVRYLCK